MIQSTLARLISGYSGLPDFRFTAGKMPNPFVTTSMTWDGDINPEGYVAEQWKHTFNISLNSGSSGATSYDKDGKTIATAQTSEPRNMTIDVFANFAQFVYDDDNPENPIGPSPTGVPHMDAYLLEAGRSERSSISPVHLSPACAHYL